MANYMACCVFLLAILIMSICVWLNVSNPSATHAEKPSTLETEGELIFVHALYRHGDRNPIFPTPGSNYANLTYWPEGWGQLSALGIQQQYSLGQWFRRRYNNFLSDEYNVNDIYVRSTDVDRTLMSAQSVLAGLYPPIGKQIWKGNLLWQPIPVHSVPASMDYLIGTQVPACPSYQNATKRYLASDKVRKYRNSVQPIFDYLSLNIGTKITTITELLLLRDTWVCESTHKYTLPQWVEKLYPNNDDVEQAVMKWYSQFTETKFMSKFVVGFLLKDMLHRFTSKIQHSLTPSRKLWMYSSHDMIIFSFFRALDISDNQFVPYAAALTLELRKRGIEHYVQIFYKSNSTEHPEPIDIPGCGTYCPLSKMYEIYDQIIPKNDFDVECLIPEEVVEMDML